MKVYLDNGATTMTDPQVSDTMVKYFTEVYGNASSLHSFGTVLQAVWLLISL